MIPTLSMRHYCKGAQLRRAGLTDWQASLLQMMVPDSRVACVLAVQHEPSLGTEESRATRFSEITGASRATYFRIKARLARAV
jgi:hypothetical protein